MNTMDALGHQSIILPVNGAEKGSLASPAAPESPTVSCLEDRLQTRSRSLLSLGTNTTRLERLSQGMTKTSHLQGCHSHASFVMFQSTAREGTTVRQLAEKAGFPSASGGHAQSHATVWDRATASWPPVQGLCHGLGMRGCGGC